MGRTMKDQTLTIAPKFLKRKTAIKKLREFADTRMERFGNLIESRINAYLMPSAAVTRAEILSLAKLANVKMFELYRVQMVRNFTDELACGVWNNTQRANTLSLSPLSHEW